MSTFGCRESERGVVGEEIGMLSGQGLSDVQARTPICTKYPLRCVAADGISLSNDLCTAGSVADDAFAKCQGDHPVANNYMTGSRL